MGALFSELYPSGVRGTGVGFCYNAGRIVSAAFPFLVGHWSESIGLGAAIGIDAAVGYSLVVVALLMLPETKATVLTDGVDTPVHLEASDLAPAAGSRG